MSDAYERGKKDGFNAIQYNTDITAESLEAACLDSLERLVALPENQCFNHTEQRLYLSGRIAGARFFEGQGDQLRQ